MMKQNIKLIFLFLIASSFISCSGIMTKVIGIKSMKLRSNEQIKKFSEKFNIPSELSFVIDTTTFCNNLSLLDSSRKAVSKDLMQPLQVRAYSVVDNNNMSFFTANCYANGFPNFKWNNSEAFNGDLLNDSLKTNDKFTGLISDVRGFLMENPNIIFTLKDDLFRLQPLYSDSKTDIYKDNSPYIVVVYWTVFMNRQSKRLIELVQDFQNRSNKEIKIYYVNIDNLYHLPCLKVG